MDILRAGSALRRRVFDTRITDSADDIAMRALSIRQPFAELILRGVKTAELRSRSTTILGERFYIYAARGTKALAQAGKPRHEGTEGIWSRDLSADDAPEWMLELAEQVKLIEPGTLLPTGVIVGSAVIRACERIDGRGSRIDEPSSILHPCSLFKWHLTDVKRIRTLRKPKRHPQPIWFRPF